MSLEYQPAQIPAAELSFEAAIELIHAEERLDMEPKKEI